ncbi:MAG: hypothetical protein J6Q75_00320 [Bacteroidaceae bacterium]|nr:hypothetical protein [Bacteroidaceae bacterium]
MKKITSFLAMVMLCCISAFAQETVGTELPKDKLIKIGTAQMEVVAGQWYFLHNPRNPNQAADAFDLEGQIQSAGGLVTDKGDGASPILTATSVIDELTSEEGVNAANYYANMVAFHPVEGKENVYKIEFGTGNWLGAGSQPVSVSKIGHAAGNSVEYNFYLIKNETDEQPNTAGRFGWNKFDMANRVDNNGAGGGVVFWSEGESVGSDLGGDNADIKGNRVWQIYSIEVVADLDKWEESFNALINAYTTIAAYQDGDALRVDNWANGVGVGTAPGNYKKEFIDAFLALHNQISDLMDLAETDGVEAVQEQYTAAQLDELTLAYNNAYVQAVQNKVPLAMTSIEPGYYYIKSAASDFWYKNVNDTTFYTQAEANEANAESGIEEGEEGYVNAGDVKEIKARQVFDYDEKAVKTNRDGNGVAGSAWGTWELHPDFLWKVERFEGDTTGTQYTLFNVGQEVYFVGINQSAATAMNATPTAVCFDYRGEQAVPLREDLQTAVTIRAAAHAENSYRYIHAGGHSNGAGTGAWCVGWADGGATRWYMQSVSEADVEAIMNSPEVLLEKMIINGNNIAAAFPAELELARDMVADINWDAPVANADNFYSPFTCTSEGSIAQLFDGVVGDLYNHWHSEWNSGSTNAYSMTNGTNYFVINDAEAIIDGGLAVEIGRRGADNDHAAELTVYGTNDEYDVATALAALKTDVTNDGYTWTKLGVLETPYASKTETIVSNAIEFEGQYKYYKFVATHTVGANYTDRGYFHMGEFQLYPAKIEKRYETVQYDVRKAEADAAAAAVEAWVAGGFSADSIELFTDEAFLANYNALLAAYNAWDAVFVNPNALRTSIYNAPADELFVVGNNPGQWAEGVATPATIVAAAKAYDATGKFTDAESEAHIKAIADILAVVYDNANPVQEGKWYRIKFPAEEMYETYGWDKTGAAADLHAASQVERSPELFGKVVAAGTSVKTFIPYEAEDGSAGETFQFTVEEAEEMFEGQALVFFEEELSNGEDLFRFIAVSDSTYIIQNKATGLYIRATYPTYLSAIPSVFQNSAIGAGANLLRAYTVGGGEDNGYNYLHANRQDNKLTTWDSSHLGSNSMLLIEEVEDVTEAPANEYIHKLWPGKFNSFAMPFDVTIGAGATAYAAQLNVSEEDTTVVLMAYEAETIKGGTPFIVVADLDGDYVSYEQSLADMKASLQEQMGDEYDSNAELMAEAIVNSENFAQIEMIRGNELATKVDTVGNLVGSFNMPLMEAGKAVVVKENGFAHHMVGGYLPPYTAWVKADFTGEDVLNSIQIKIEGSIDTGINEALSNVAKGGNIYTVGGQLVGKGNINTVNNLPAGIYVVNGVKVIKK